jgi:hypothetical protein
MIDNKYSGPTFHKSHKNFQYDRKFQQLKVILADKNYWPEGNSDTGPNGYKHFVSNMKDAINSSRDITPKMHKAIYDIVTRYIGATDPVKVQERNKRIETINDKLDVVKNALKNAQYLKSTEYGGISFLDSIAQQVSRTGKLSIKQKEALNKMHVKALKRIAKKSNEK